MELSNNIKEENNIIHINYDNLDEEALAYILNNYKNKINYIFWTNNYEQNKNKSRKI